MSEHNTHEMHHISMTFSQLLKLTGNASVVDWARDNARISIYIDDHTADTRRVYTMCLITRRGEVRRLSGYDQRKCKWMNWGEATPLQCPDGRGEKALRKWIEGKAVELTGVVNPLYFQYFQRPAGSNAEETDT